MSFFSLAQELQSSPLSSAEEKVAGITTAFIPLRPKPLTKHSQALDQLENSKIGNTVKACQGW